MKFKKWSRLNPDFSKKLDFARINMLFDGDHALGNNFTMRKHTTIEQVLQKIEEKEAYLKAKKEYEESLENFKEQASNGEISINLKDLNDKWFYESDSYDEFWRVAFEIHKKQNKE